MAIRSSLVCGCVLVAGLCATTAPAFAYDDGYQNVFSSVLGAVGVLSPDKSPDIEYRERPPLVVPPKMDLSKPGRSAPLPAAWPQDPDVIKARKANEAARAPLVGSFDKSANSGGVLSREELAKGRGGTDAPEPRQCGTFGNGDAHCLLLSPDELRSQGERYRAQNPESKDEVTAGVEPDRLYLTQPPKGYMKPTKTVKVTTEAPQVKHDDSNPNAALVYRPNPNDE